MVTREQLLRRPDVREDDIDDIIGAAAELQEAARAGQAGRVSVEDVEKVAAELDIDPAFVEQAITKLARDRAAAEEAAKAAAADAARARAARTARLRRVGLVGAGLAVVGMLLGGGLAMQGAAALAAARGDVAVQEAALVEVVERQADLAPQLVALAGGDIAALSDAVASVRAAPDADARLHASRALLDALSVALGKLPPAQGDMAAQQRLELHHEITGSRNRVDVAARRLAEARVALGQVSHGFGPRLAIGVGLADPVPALPP